MIRKQNYGKRFLTMALATLMLFSSINGGLLSLVPANAVEYESITDGELLVNNYDLSDGENALLLSGLLKETTHVYEVSPTAEDNLVEVDGEAKTITAKTFKHAGFVWYPKEATVVNGDNHEVVALAPSGDNYVGAFTTEGNTYSVQVTYELHIEVTEAQQEQLLQAGASFGESVSSLNKLATLVKMLDTKPEGEEETGRQMMVRIVEGLMTWVNGVPAVMLGKNFYYPGKFEPDEDSAAPIKALDAQMKANDGNLDLFVMLDAYNKAPSQTQYLIENGKELLATAQETADYLTAILAEESSVLSMLDLSVGMQVELPITSADMVDFYKSLKVILNGGTYAGIEFAGLNATVNAPWTVLEKNPLKEGMTTVEYQLLDTLVENLPAEATEVTINEKLLAATATVQVNMNRYDILVKVAANVIERNAYDSTLLKNLVSDKTALFTVNKGATYAEVMEAIEESGVVADALADWNVAYQVGDTHYTQAITGIGAEDVVESDLVVTITYTPKNYTVTGVEGFPSPVPYGYNQTLPTYPIDAENPDNPDNKRVYDYEINGVSYRQGSVYRVVGDTTVVRTDGEPWVDGTWGEAVAHAVSDKAALVLQSAALRTGTLSIRYPSAKGITQKTNLDGSTDVKALSADSGIEGLYWVPARAYYVNGEQKVQITNFANGTGSFTVADYDKVVVEYDLVLNGIVPDADLLNLLNLPGVLAQQAKDQKSTMDRFASMKGSLGQLADYIGALELLLETNKLTDEGKAALRILVNECYNTQTEKMYLYEYLNSYDTYGLTWYYTGSNFETFAAEFNKLKSCMNDFLDATPNLRALMEDFNIGDKYDMVDGVRNDLNSVELVAPHAAIRRDANSDMMNALVAAIEGASASEIYTQLPNIVMTLEREQTAENKRSVTIKLSVDGKLDKSFSLVFTVGQTLGQAHIDRLVAQLAAMNNALSIDKRFYDYASMELPAVGTVMNANIELEYSYTAKTFDAIVGGVGAVDTFSIHKSDITLPACGVEGYRYQYIINGELIETYNAAVVYPLSLEQKLFLLGGGEIRRVTVDVQRQNLLNFVSKLNESLISGGSIGGASFIPVEDVDGNISLIWKVSPLASSFNPQDLLMGVALTIINSQYSYIDMDGFVVRDGTQIHIQGLVDALLNTNFTLNDVANAINANGTINNMTLPGYAVVMDGIDLSKVPQTNIYGGKLMEMDLNLAANETAVPTSVKLYITLGDNGANAGKLQTLDKGLNAVTPYVNIHLVNGNANLVLNLPDKAYQAFLGAMLISGNTQLGNINDLDYGLCVEYLYDLIDPLLRDDSITTDSFENTIGALNKDVDLSAAQGVLTAIQKVLRHLYTNVEYSNAGAIGNVYQQDMAYPMDNLLSKLPIPEDLLSVIAEKGGKLEATLGVQLKNVDTKYEALVIDLNASKLDKVDFVTDLEATIAKIHDNAVVILVDDFDGSIVTNKKIFLDLNGKTVSGDVLGSGITVVDSTIGNLGKIAGRFNGTDRRTNNLYTTVAEGDTINVYLNTGLWTMDERPALTNFAVDLALDLVLNYYTTAALTLDEDVIYSVDMGDIVGMLESGAASSLNTVIDFLNCEGLSNFATKLMNDLTDFAALAEAAKAGDKLLSYTVGSRAWNVSISHDKENDYITGGIVPSENESVKTLNIFLGGTDAEKQAVIDLLEDLGKIVDAEFDFNLEDINYADRVVSVTGGASASVVIDTKGDHGYAVALAILLANDQKNNTAIVEALESYFNENRVAPLKKIIDNTTVAQLFSAVKEINRSTNFAAMASKLGLNPEHTVRSVQIMEIYRNFFVAASKALRALDVTGPSVKLSNFATEGESGAYDLTKTLDRAGTIKVLGYDVELAVSLKLVLFNVEPSFDGYIVEVKPNDNIYGSKVDAENMQIILDAKADGLTVEELKEILTHSASNADRIDMNVDAADLVDGKVVNGATVEFVASNNSTSIVDTVTYTVIILGDVNSDGKNNVADAVALMRHVMKEHDLTQAVGEYALLAADTNCDLGLNVADAVMIMRKCMNDNYVSVLN